MCFLDIEGKILEAWIDTDHDMDLAYERKRTLPNTTPILRPGIRFPMPLEHTSLKKLFRFWKGCLERK